jgi:DNA-binding NarL/FixJ family response regulator
MASAIAVVRDLIFSSKIIATARAEGIDARIVSTTNALQDALDVGDVALVIVDMSLPNDDAPAALRCSASHASEPTTVAFYSHVQSELRQAAEQAGADHIMARSKFNEDLPQLLRAHCAKAD